MGTQFTTLAFIGIFAILLSTGCQSVGIDSGSNDAARLEELLNEDLASLIDSLGDEMDDELPSPRAPASAQAKASRSRLPKNVSDGFEFRVRSGGVTSAFWVTKKSDRHSLVFANNTGTKATVTLTPEVFSFLHSNAQSLASPKAALAKCPKDRILVHTVSGGRVRNITTCLNARGKAADTIRSLGTQLAAMAL